MMENKYFKQKKKEFSYFELKELINCMQFLKCDPNDEVVTYGEEGE